MRIIKNVLIKVENEDIVDGKFEIPDGVEEIEGGAFEDCSSLTSIKIPDRVEFIQNSAFEGCSSLTSIKIPDSVRWIGRFAFCRCSSLTSIEIPDGVTSIDKLAFCRCSSLTSIEIPDGVTRIGDSTFYGCSSLTNIEIPDSVEEIKNSTFINCSSLTSIEIPDSVTGIGSSAFEGCESLTSIKIPNSVTGIFDRVFGGCSSLTNIEIPDSVRMIGDGAFEGCESLTNIEIPDSVTSIGDGAFVSCSSLTNIEIPDGVTRIGDNTFEGCKSLTSIKIPDSVTSIGDDAFFDCSSLNNIKFNAENEYLLFLMWKKAPQSMDSKLMFGEDISRFEGIKSQAHFQSSADYDEKFMDELYHKIIFSVGIDELERMVKIPNISEEKIKAYMLDKEESFNTLYDTKAKITGDFGTTLRILKSLNLNKKFKDSEESKNTAELRIFKEMNRLLENEENISLVQLIETSIQNAGYDSQNIHDEIVELQRSINKEQFQINIEKSKSELQDILSSTDERYGEPIVYDQISAIQSMLEDELRKIYIENSKINIQGLEGKIISNLTGEDRAPYIRQNARNITNRLLLLLGDENSILSQTMNHSSVDAIRNVRASIGGKWIASIKNGFQKVCNQKIESIPDSFSAEQIEQLEKILGINIETRKTANPKKDADREMAYKLLEEKQENMPDEEKIIITYKQLHDMFGPIHNPYSQEFMKYFKKHREEFLFNPRYMYEFHVIHNNFEQIINSNELKNIYQNGNLEIDDILGYLGKIKFENQRPGDEKVAKLASTVAKIKTEEEFEEVQKVFDIVRKRERTSIPPIYVQEKGKKMRGRMLSPNDILTMFAGNLTDCCQKFGDVGMGAMLLGAIEENAGIFVIEELQENGNYQIIGQSLTIRQKGKDGNYDRLTFDNVEITKNVKARLSEDDKKEILRIYQKAGMQVIENDQLFLKKQLEEGKISQETYNNLVLKEVIAGRGYNDLSILDTLPEAESIVPDEAYYNYRTKRKTIQPWIDSTSGGAPNGSNAFIPVVIASMDQSKIESLNLSTDKKSNLDEVTLWYGKLDEIADYTEDSIGEEQIDVLKEIEKMVYRDNQQLLNNEGVTTGKRIARIYGLESDTHINIGSENNWYLIYGTDYDGDLNIADLALEGGLNSRKNEKNDDTQRISKLAISEMVSTLYDIMIKGAKDNRKIVCNATKDTSLVNIKRMIKRGLAEIYDKNGEKIVLNQNNELVYETGKSVQYQDFDGDSGIEMLDLEIRPDVEKMLEEKIKIERTLNFARRERRLIAKEKEEGIDELRRTMRDDLSSER